MLYNTLWWQCATQPNPKCIHGISFCSQKESAQSCTLRRPIPVLASRVSLRCLRFSNSSPHQIRAAGLDMLPVVVQVYQNIPAAAQGVGSWAVSRWVVVAHLRWTPCSSRRARFLGCCVRTWHGKRRLSSSQLFPKLPSGGHRSAVKPHMPNIYYICLAARSSCAATRGLNCWIRTVQDQSGDRVRSQCLRLHIPLPPNIW